MPDFNFIAEYYDRIKKLVFGSFLDEASAYFIRELNADSQVLIIGGGSGDLLAQLPAVKQLVYIDSSIEMIKLAKRNHIKSEVEFVNLDVREVIFSQQFDVVITPFFLDCFSQKNMEEVVFKLSKQLTKSGYWIQTDFYPKHYFHKFLIKCMYLFFRYGAKLDILQLPEFEKAFHKGKFKLEKKVLFWGGMVESRKYKNIA